MATVLCTMTECRYCGRKSAKWQMNNGNPIYTCKREEITIRPPFDISGEISEIAGVLACCKYFDEV